MIGIDTNVLVRYLTQDDPEQSAVANHIIECQVSNESPGFITLVTMVELVWVSYRFY